MSLKHTMFVLGLEFNNAFQLFNLFELLPIVPIIGFKFKKDNPIPYFGMDDVIVSIVPNEEIGKTRKTRGLRRLPISEPQSEPFGNAIAVDFQSAGKNLHIKISSSLKKCSKFHITGAKTLEMAEEVSNKLINYINLTNEMWKPFYLLSYEQRFYLLNKIIDDLVSNNGEMLLYDSPLLLEKFNRDKEFYQPYITAVDFILRFTFECENLNEFKMKLKLISQIVPGSFSIFHNQLNISHGKIEIYNGTYTGNINCEDLVLHHISTILVSKGYNSSFHNINSKPLTIIIPILDDNNCNIIQVNNKIKAHKFDIKAKGTFRLYSKALPDEVFTIGYFIINLIKEIIYSDEYKKLINPNYYDNTSVQDNNFLNVSLSLMNSIPMVSNTCIQPQQTYQTVAQDYNNDF